MPVEGFRSEAEKRFEELLAQYGAFIRRTVARLCPRSIGVVADEVEQEARIRLWRAVRDERDIKEPASYLYRIAAAAAIDAVRRVRARRESQVDEADENVFGSGTVRAFTRSPEQLVGDRQLASQVRAALARLPENRRRAVALHLRGFTTAEIGRLLGWSEPKARNLAYRGLQDLREDLKTNGIGVTERT